MQKRKLGIVKQSPPAIGVCERCNAQFKNADIQAQFDAHKCKPVDSSQNALRILIEATDNKWQSINRALHVALRRSIQRPTQTAQSAVLNIFKIAQLASPVPIG